MTTAQNMGCVTTCRSVAALLGAGRYSEISRRINLRSQTYSKEARSWCVFSAGTIALTLYFFDFLYFSICHWILRLLSTISITFSPQVRVRAMNPLGWSDWSDRATVETAKPTLTDMQQSGQKLGFFQIISAIPEGYEELIKCVHRVLLLLSTDNRALVSFSPNNNLIFTIS